MASNHKYDPVPALQETQDIGEYLDTVWTSGDERPVIEEPALLKEQVSRSSLPQYSYVQSKDGRRRTSLDSFATNDTGASASSGLEKLKSGLKRIGRKPPPSYARNSVEHHPAAAIEPTRIGRGVWKDQLLVDRSLRGMAVLTSAFAVAMIITLCVYAKAYGERSNKYTSSVGGKASSCKHVTRTNTALLLFINVAATMALGMSNTYQQIITSLRISDLKHVFEVYGDARVGTNSPLNIKHKSHGKKRAWAGWALLISTSLPIHFLANSLIGPSFVHQAPPIVEFNKTASLNELGTTYHTGESTTINAASYLCWSAFRTGVARIAADPVLFDVDSGNLFADVLGTSFGKMVVNYVESNCTGLANSAKFIDEDSWYYDPDANYPERSFSDGPGGACKMGSSVSCTSFEVQEAQCRINVRMNAAFVLAAVLTVKAIYMIAVNIRARGQLKRQLLTFGDVIVASASDPELRVQGECMVNAQEAYRRLNSHACHKHCTNPQDSKTGDELGHCQKCKVWNSTNKLAHLPQPAIATKIKRNFISNLGNVALTQMIILMFCSLAMLSASLAIAVSVFSGYAARNHMCKGNSYAPSSDDAAFCKLSTGEQFAELSGGFGGFNRSLPITTLPPDQLGNEMASFAISNGAQFIYSLLYLLLIYNITLVSQEYDWGKLEHARQRLRATIVRGKSFSQDYLLQLPKKLLYPIMTYSVITHWMLGEALQTQEVIWIDDAPGRHVEHSMYSITYAAYPLWFATVLLLTMTGVCWWAFTYRREGYIPQMFGSMRVLCAATTQLDDFPSNGIQWGDLGEGKKFRHAGLSADDVGMIVPNELYAGRAD